MTEQEFTTPSEGMLVRPAHKTDGFRTIIKVDRTLRKNVIDGTEGPHVKVDFLLVKDQSIIKTPWYPERMFWTYYALCDET